jgi:mono/diheme cytochrome c family protein
MRTITTVLGIASLMLAGSAQGIEYDLFFAEMGEPVFKRYCASCHGTEAQGDGPSARILKVPPPDLTRIAERRKGEFATAEIGRFIDGRFDTPSHGTRDMPIWGTRLAEAIPEPGLGEEVVRGQIFILLEYLKSIQVVEPET